MPAIVSFYLIAILAQGVKNHSLQERNVLWNVLIEDHHVQGSIRELKMETFSGRRRPDWQRKPGTKAAVASRQK